MRYLIHAVKNTEFQEVWRTLKTILPLQKKKYVLFKKRRNIAVKQLMFMFPFFSQHRAHKMGWNKSIATSLRVLWRKFLYPAVYGTHDTSCIKKNLNVSHKKKIRNPWKASTLIYVQLLVFMFYIFLEMKIL